MKRKILCLFLVLSLILPFFIGCSTSKPADTEELSATESAQPEHKTRPHKDAEETAAPSADETDGAEETSSDTDVTAEPTEPEPTESMEPLPVYFSDEEVIAAANELYSDMLKYQGQDYDRFASLYTPDTKPQSIESIFNSDPWRPNFDPDKTIVFIAGENANNFYINVIEYIVTGTHPNTHMSSSNVSLPIKYEDNAWKIDGNPMDLIEVKDNYNIYFPNELVNAFLNGRNVAIFDGNNFMYTDSSLVYEGCSNNEVKFAWQNEDGSVCVSVWFANGTPQNIYYNNSDTVLTDSELGEIVTLDGNLDVPLKSMSSGLYTYTIPADEVKTGTQPWGSVHASCDVSFK